jgi:hypothetical protein
LVVDQGTATIVAALIAAAVAIIGWVVNRKTGPKREQTAPTAAVERERGPDTLQTAKRILGTGSATAPVLNDLAKRYSELSTQDEKKNLIRPVGQGFASGTISLTRPQMEVCAGSDWEFDRIALYLFREANLGSDLDARLRSIEQEWDEVTAKDFKGSLVPLHYYIRSFLRLIEKKPVLAGEARTRVDWFRRMLNTLRFKPHLDEGNHVKGNLESIIRILENR